MLFWAKSKFKKNEIDVLCLLNNIILKIVTQNSISKG